MVPGAANRGSAQRELDQTLPYSYTIAQLACCYLVFNGSHDCAEGQGWVYSDWRVIQI